MDERADDVGNVGLHLSDQSHVAMYKAVVLTLWFSNIKNDRWGLEPK
jgi:hypothetical protein